ncbi:MAG: YIP1 family protein [Acidobacteria bacterium]|nr:YIP1 family protein [Acidobacteriota bacterium]
METDNQTEWTAPPPPEKITVEQAEMSEVATLANIFFEPGRTFEDLRRKPRFVLATLIIAICVAALTFGMTYKVGDEGLRRSMMDQFNKNQQTASMSTEQKNEMVDMQLKIGAYTRYAIPVIVIIFLFLGGLFYFLGAKAFGGSGGFLHGLSVWVYSSLPPALVSTVANMIVLIFKSADEIDIIKSQRGLLQANLSMLFPADSNAVLVTIISFFDLFAIWGWILAAIGLRITNRISSGSAWAIVIILTILLNFAPRLIGAIFSGNPS